MRNRNSAPRRAVGIALIVIGTLLVLAVGGYLGWMEYRGAQLRAQLRQTPTAVPPAPTAAASPTAVPSPTAVATASPSPVASPAPTAATATPGLVPTLPATATPTRPPSPTPAPTATQAPTADKPGTPVRIVIPDLKVDAPVVPMGWKVVQTATGLQSEWDLDALKNGVGHHINSAGLGMPGNLVISGHNNIFGMEFAAISLAWDDDKKQKLDDYTERSDILNGRTIQLFSADGRRFDYTITEFYRLKDSGVPLTQRIANGRFMEPTEDTRLTLVTCWPITSNTHRLIVIAKPAKS